MMTPSGAAQPVGAYTVVYRFKDLKNKYDPLTGKNETGDSFCGVKDHNDFMIHKVVIGALCSFIQDDHRSQASKQKKASKRSASHQDRENERHRRATGGPPAYSVCLVTLVSDSSFYNNNGGSTGSVTSLMVRMRRCSALISLSSCSI